MTHPLCFANFRNIFFFQNNVEKIWDLVSLHESVSIIIFNTDRKKLVLVKQFRPGKRSENYLI